MKETANFIRVGWIKNLSEVINNLMLSLNSLPNFDATDFTSNIPTILTKDTGYLIRKSNKSYDAEAFENNLSTRIYNIAIDICNTTTKIIYLDSKLYKYTSFSFKNICCISANIASCEEDFERIINACYELFYEGFGKDNMRTEQYVHFDDYPALIDIKNIRLFYDHDIEHGDDNKIKGTKGKIFNIFMIFINKKIPSTSKDFKECQYRLYLEIKEWLSAILDKLNETTDNLSE